MNTEVLSAAAPYIIRQNYAANTAEQHAVWAELVGRVLPELEKHAAREYLDGFEIIGLQTDRLPNLESISARLAPRTGWSSTPVSGFLPAPAFFEMLASAQLSHHNVAAQPRVARIHARARHLSRCLRPRAHALAQSVCGFP